MRFEVEKRLHRVKIKLNKGDVKCPNSNHCYNAENCYRCNKYYDKCSFYLNK